MRVIFGLAVVFALFAYVQYAKIPEWNRDRLKSIAADATGVVTNRSADTGVTAEPATPPASTDTSNGVDAAKTAATALTDAGTEAYEFLSTKDLGSLLAQRGTWGAGAPAKPVAAPLAAGAVSPLPMDAPVTTEAAAADPIINPAEERAPVEMTAVDASQVQASLSDLLKERESWGTAPWGDEVAAGQAGYPILSTSDLGALMEQRAGWGAGAPPKAVKAPLAAGAVSPLPSTASAAASTAEAKPPIINPLDVRAPVKLSAQPQAQLNKELAALLDERASWGTEPSAASASSDGGYPILATASLNDLLKQRASWGGGAEPKAVKSPLAAGAQFPLPKDAAVSVAADAPEPI
ncbi:MAG: hypothetical protein AAFO75_09595, partial [Pseudomonadota bacterium]